MRAGREISIDFLPFERAKHVLLTEPATLMPALFKGKRNDDAFHWIAEIGRANLRFGALARPVNSLDEARDLQAVVVEIGTTAEALLDNHGFDNLIRVTSPEASARMLAAGRADAWILSDRLMRKTWADLGLSDALIFGDVVHETPIFLVASPTLPAEVSAAYRRAIEGMRRDGRFQQLAERYDFSAARP